MQHKLQYQLVYNFIIIIIIDCSTGITMEGLREYQWMEIIGQLLLMLPGTMMLYSPSPWTTRPKCSTGFLVTIAMAA